MAGRTVLVTGATGFTGGHLARRLVREGNTVRAIVRGAERGGDLVSSGIEVVPGDLSDPAALKAATKGVDTVYHIAAIYRQQGVDPKMFHEVNARGTERLLDASIANDVSRFVHCSTIGVHGDIAQPPANENAPLRPDDLYQESKLEGERIAERYMSEGKIALSIFRPGGMYGPGDRRFLKLFKAIKKKRFLMLGNGEIFYHFTYIDDLIDGIILCGTKDVAIGQTYILLGRRYFTLNQVVAMIARELDVKLPSFRLPLWPFYLAGALCEIACKPIGVEPPIYRRRVDFFKKSRAFDISKARAELGYDPKIDLPDGIRMTTHWYQRNDLI